MFGYEGVFLPLFRRKPSNMIGADHSDQIGTLSEIDLAENLKLR